MVYLALLWSRAESAEPFQEVGSLSPFVILAMSDLLDPAVLLSSLPNLLPPSFKKLDSPHDGIAALLHTIMSAVGFRLIAVDDAGTARSVLENVLPDEWNKNGPGNYTFRYKHEQSSLEFVLKVAKLGGRTLVNAIATEVHAFIPHFSAID